MQFKKPYLCKIKCINLIKRIVVYEGTLFNISFVTIVFM